MGPRIQGSDPGILRLGLRIYGLLFLEISWILYGFWKSYISESEGSGFADYGLNVNFKVCG